MGHLVTLFQKNKIIVQDGFNRADNAISLGSANTGQAWQTLNGIWGINGNRAYFVSGTGSSYYASVIQSASNAILQVQFAVEVTDVHVVFRVVDIDNLWMFRYNSANTWHCYKRVLGVYTLMGTNTFTAADRDNVKIVFNADSIQCYVNGVLIITVNDSFNQTQAKHGLECNNTLIRYDNYTVEVL